MECPLLRQIQNMHKMAIQQCLLAFHLQSDHNFVLRSQSLKWYLKEISKAEILGNQTSEFLPSSPIISSSSWIQELLLPLNQMDWKQLA